MAKILTKENLVFFGALALFAVLMWQWRGQIETITPGQELMAECIIDDNCGTDEVCDKGRCMSFYPKFGECDNKEVMVYGRPSFYTDEAMQHMVGMPCSNDDQCEKWPPIAAEGIATSCCINKGVCIGFI